MPPPLAGPANATAPPEPPDTPDDGGPGAVPSGGPGAIPDQGQGMLPPTTAPGPGRGGISPTGNQALGDQLMSNIVGAMHYARMFYPPGSEKEKAISHHFKGLSKLFMPDSGTMKGGTMPPVNQVARGPGGGAPPGGPPGGGPPGPPLGGMGGAAGGPPAPPRGPMPVRGGPPGAGAPGP